MSAFLARHSVSPDAISLAGMLASCAGAACLCAVAFAPGASGWLWLATAASIQLRLLANMLDGMVAIERGVASAVGELFNDLPDRVSDSVLLAGLGVAADDVSLGMFAALAAMATAYVRVLGRSVGAASVFAGPMAKQHRMAVMTALALAQVVASSAWSRPMSVGTLWAIAGLLLLTALRRLAIVAGQLRAAARA